MVLPEYTDGAFGKVIQTYRDLFRNTPGKTTLAQHYIPTSGPALKVPPRRIPAEYRDEVDHMIKEMLDEGIIEESSSPWMAPAVYEEKKDGSVRLCVDCRALNNPTVQDTYILCPYQMKYKIILQALLSIPLLIFSQVTGQIPVHPTDCEKTAFCTGPPRVISVSMNAIRIEWCRWIISASHEQSVSGPELCQGIRR